MFHFLLNAAAEVQTTTLPHINEHLKTTDLAMPSTFRLILAFVGLILALGLVIWILKKLSGAKKGFFHQSSSLKVIEKKTISPKTVLYVIDYNGQHMLLTESCQHIKLTDLTQTDQDT
jgi:flagellar biogenesis protein FliO